MKKMDYYVFEGQQLPAKEVGAKALDRLSGLINAAGDKREELRVLVKTAEKERGKEIKCGFLKRAALDLIFDELKKKMLEQQKAFQKITDENVHSFFGDIEESVKAQDAVMAQAGKAMAEINEYLLQRKFRNKHFKSNIYFAKKLIKFFDDSIQFFRGQFFALDDEVFHKDGRFYIYEGENFEDDEEFEDYQDEEGAEEN